MSDPTTTGPSSALAGLETVHLLVSDERPLLERSSGVQRAIAGVDAAAACRALAALGDADVGATIAGRTVDELADFLAEHGVKEILLHGSGDVQIVPLTARPAERRSCPLVMVVDAGFRPDRDHDSGATLLEMRRERVRSGDLSPLALDAWITSDQDLYVPCHDEMLKREFWPRFERNGAGSGTSERGAVFEFFTSVEAAAERVGPGGRVVAIGGREALRWANAAPVPLDSIVIDPHTDDPIVLGAARVRAALFPATIAFRSIDELPEFDASDLTSFLPFDADTALVTGTLLRGWHDVLVPTGPSTDDSAPAGFTGQSSFVDALKGIDTLSNPVSPSEAPPFRDWLAHAASTGAVVLDPGRPAPLELDLVRLFLLGAWAEVGHGLDATTFARALGREAANASIAPEWVGRFAAQWPYWIVGRSEDRKDWCETRPWIATEDGALALFSSESELATFVERERAHGRLRGAWTSQTRTLSLEQDLFALAKREYAGCVVDPAGVGVRLEGEGLEGAERALRGLLQPRHMRD